MIFSPLPCNICFKFVSFLQSGNFIYFLQSSCSVPAFVATPVIRYHDIVRAQDVRQHDKSDDLEVSPGDFEVLLGRSPLAACHGEENKSLSW
jgi:hypothetical protein